MDKTFAEWIIMATVTFFCDFRFDFFYYYYLSRARVDNTARRFNVENTNAHTHTRVHSADSIENRNDLLVAVNSGDVMLQSVYTAEHRVVALDELMSNTMVTSRTSKCVDPFPRRSSSFEVSAETPLRVIIVIKYL